MSKKKKYEFKSFKFRGGSIDGYDTDEELKDALINFIEEEKYHFEEGYSIFSTKKGTNNLIKRLNKKIVELGGKEQDLIP